MKSRGFTLIELLVVIGIIALLIGILLPTLGKAREAGRMAVCASQEKQILTAVHVFATDHDSFIPPGLMSLSPASPFPAQPWDDTIAEYLGTTLDRYQLSGNSVAADLANPLLSCPADPTGSDNDAAARTYAMPGQDPSNPIPTITGTSPSFINPTGGQFDDDNDRQMFLHCLGMWITIPFQSEGWEWGESGSGDNPVTGGRGGIVVTDSFSRIIRQHRSRLVNLDRDVIEPSGTFALAEYSREAEDFNNQSAGLYAVVPGPAYLIPDYDDVHLLHAGDRDDPVLNFGYADGHVASSQVRDTLGTGKTLQDQFPGGPWSMATGD
jgi:prepilin-type N-terminal cleavage/methylation domain-containing protein/prepilin-type processing-associated H-X9-DG protein